MYNYHANNKQKNCVNNLFLFLAVENLRITVFNNHEVEKSEKPIVQTIINNCKQLFRNTYIEIAAWMQ